jgi:hypothetical protein
MPTNFVGCYKLKKLKLKIQVLIRLFYEILAYRLCRYNLLFRRKAVCILANLLISSNMYYQYDSTDDMTRLWNIEFYLVDSGSFKSPKRISCKSFASISKARAIR